MNILCIGAGYVGGPTMAVLALHCPQDTVMVVDVNQERIDQWNSDNLPIYEPGLQDVVETVRGRNLFFSCNIAEEIPQADIIFIAINTPTKQFGEGAGSSADLQYWEQTARSILKYARKPNVIVIEKSTLPVRAAAAMGRILKSGSTATHFEVISNPEFLAEGTAIQDLQNPDRVLIGSAPTDKGIRASEVLTSIYSKWVPREKILQTNVWSSELSKLFANAMLAQRISSINSLSALCEQTGADISEVSKAIGMDKRIGERFLNASLGFGGSCFRKDILHLAYLCEYYGLPEVAEYWSHVVHMNDYQTLRFFKRILRYQFNTLVGKQIAIFGFAFKANTGDTRDSPAITLCHQLIEEKAELRITDPKALENAKKDLADAPIPVTFSIDPYQAAKEAHAIIIATDWREFKHLDYKKMFQSMNQPAFIFDGRNLLNAQELYQIGFNVVPLGKKALLHFADTEPVSFSN